MTAPLRLSSLSTARVHYTYMYNAVAKILTESTCNKLFKPLRHPCSKYCASTVSFPSSTQNVGLDRVDMLSLA